MHAATRLENFVLKRSIGICVALAALVLAASPALAQKAKDTLRIALNEFVPVISPYDLTLNELSRIYRQVYSSLLRYDEYKGQYVPDLAKSWKRLDDKTIEFELRDDITFHSGNKFSADDVVYTINYIIDPELKIPGKARYFWIKGAEKVGPYTVRIMSKDVAGIALDALAYEFYILDSKVHQALADKTTYGRVSASSAGPYKLVSMDPRRGALLQRFDGFKGDPKYHRAPIKYIQLVPIPERQTQIAQLLTGGVDVLRNVEPDIAAGLAANPDLASTTVPSGEFIYLLLDAAGRSGVAPLKDVRVRRAIAMAIDRQTIGKTLVSGGAAEPPMDALCFPTTVACAWIVKPPTYDPAGARKLLAEAGYPNGFNAPFYVHSPIKQVGEAIALQLQKVGIRTTVESLPITVYTQKRGEGQLSIFVGSRPTTTFPETTQVFLSLFGGQRDYAKDPLIDKAVAAAEKTFDPKERAKILQAAIDRNNEMVYVLPIASLPTLLVHGKNVRVERNLLSANDVEISDYFWK